MNPLEGIIRVTGKAVGYFPIPDMEEDFEVQPENLATALNGDTVKVVPLGTEKFMRKQAKVVEIVRRRKTAFVGTFEKADDTMGDGFVVPDDKRMYRDIFIPKGESQGAESGSKVQAEIKEWQDTSKSPHGSIIRIIGRAGEHNAEMEGIVYESGFEIGFPIPVEKEAEAWEKKFEKEDHLKGRKDFRETTTFTIDPLDAKDFDDAISVKKLDNGNSKSVSTLLMSRTSLLLSQSSITRHRSAALPYTWSTAQYRCSQKYSQTTSVL
jgi:ribonuclease R